MDGQNLAKLNYAESAFSFISLGGVFFFQRRDESTAIAAPGKLACFGGALREGETPEEAVRREIAEETSLCVDGLAFQYLGEVIVRPGNGRIARRHVFRAELSPERAEGGSPLPSHQSERAFFESIEVFEGQGGEAYSLSELGTIPENDFAPSTWIALNRYIFG